MTSQVVVFRGVWLWLVIGILTVTMMAMMTIVTMMMVMMVLGGDP